MDSPAGVGFSYSNNKDDYTTGDNKTASDTHKFLLEVHGMICGTNFTVIFFYEKNLYLIFIWFDQWFKLYPEFLSNSFFIAGESYAGVYVPTLAAEIAKGAF